MVKVLDDIPAAIRELGELVVVSLGIHEQGPVHEEEVDIVETELLQALLETQLDTGVVGGPDLGDDEDVLALDAGCQGVPDALADFVLVAVAVGAIDQLVAVLECEGDSFLDFALLALPCACTMLVVCYLTVSSPLTEANGRHLEAIVQCEGLVRHCSEVVN